MKSGPDNPKTFAETNRDQEEFVPKIALPHQEVDFDSTRAYQEIASNFNDPTLMLGGNFAPERQLNCDKKQEFDIYFAATLTRNGKLNERQLAKAISNWTIFGNQPLSDFLVEEEIITADEKERFESETKQQQDQADSTLQNGNEVFSATQLVNAKIGMVDASGRLARLLGVGGSEVPITIESRKTKSEFKLLRKIGEGGLGTVWLARDEKLRRYVAVKEIRADRMNEAKAILPRFRREAEITGRLEHPGIVPLYQFGQDVATGSYFYVMRFLGKKTLQDSIQEYHERREAGNDDPIHLHRLLNVIITLCQSVAHAHSRKIIHRDLKPENVALDSFGQVVLIDWGLAKLNDETGLFELSESCGEEVSNLNDSQMTMNEQVLGSPMYMAPEQAAGRLDEIDERTDVYGLGGILYATLTGQSPHETMRDSTTSNMSELFSSILKTPVRPAREIVPRISPELDAICTKALEKKRYLRYSSASELAEDLERYMAGGKVTAYNETGTERIKRWVSANPRVAQGIGGVLLSIFVLAIILGMGYRQKLISDQQDALDRAKTISRELAYSLQSESRTLIEDVRFISGLPSIQGIIEIRRKEKSLADQAQSKTSDVTPKQKSPESAAENSAQKTVDPTSSNARDTNAASQSGSATSEDSEETWKDRLASTFHGLLNRHSSYLVFGFAELSEKPKQVVRIERNVMSNEVFRVPDSQMAKIGTASEEFDEFRNGRRGDASIATGDMLPDAAPTSNRDPLMLIALSQVFDNVTGDFFGLTAVELDLHETIKSRLRSIGRTDVDVYVTDRLGNVELYFEKGENFSEVHHGKNVTQIFPKITLFDSDNQSNTFTDDQRIFSQRVTLGKGIARSKAIVGIVVVLVE